MAKEIERKFLVRDTKFLRGLVGTPIVQGYLNEEGMTTRVRIAGAQAWITLKGKISRMAKDEYEYPIPLSDAKEMLKKYCGRRIVVKTRYCIPVGKHTFEVDVFAGALDGFVMAEVEMRKADEKVVLPIWIGREVTGVRGFSNRSLSKTQEIPKLKKRAA